MTNPIRDETAAKMVREFVTQMRDHIAGAQSESELEVLVNRFLGGLAAAGGVALTLRRKHDALAATLFAVAVGLWTKPQEAPRA